MERLSQALSRTVMYDGCAGNGPGFYCLRWSHYDHRHLEETGSIDLSRIIFIRRDAILNSEWAAYIQWYENKSHVDYEEHVVWMVLFPNYVKYFTTSRSSGSGLAPLYALRRRGCDRPTCFAEQSRVRAEGQHWCSRYCMRKAMKNE